MEITTRQANYSLISELGILVNSELTNDLRHLIPGKIDEAILISKLQAMISDEEIESQLASILNITLNLTDDCNFRCRYCIYSGNYQAVRKHNPVKMSIDTATKAIDIFISWIMNKKRAIKSNLLNIGFYGGEPLTEINLMKDIIRYQGKKFKENKIDDKFKVDFQANTNGWLLNDDTIRFLVENRMNLNISLDGPAQEHNKFRVFRNGKPTWDMIWENISRLKSNYPDYYQKKVRFLCTLHPFHDIQAIDQFFLEKKDFFNRENISVYYVNQKFLKNKTKEKWFKGKKIQESKISRFTLDKRLEEKLRLKYLCLDSNFTTMCFPGAAKLFVTTDGKFHICERVKSTISIGDVNNGIDFNAIKRIKHQWNQEIIRQRCWECNAWSFCDMCISQSGEKNGVHVDCIYKNFVKDDLSQFIRAKENSDIDGKIANNSMENSSYAYIRSITQGTRTADGEYLKPWVSLIEGSKNLALYDMINGNFFRFSADMPIDQLREILVNEKLIFHTNGIVPHKVIGSNMKEIQDKIHLRVLQIRLNGRKEDYCWNRQKNDLNFSSMDSKTLERLSTMCRYIPIERIQIEAEVINDKQIQFIMGNFKADEVLLSIDDGINNQMLQDLMANLCKKTKLSILKRKTENITKGQLKISSFFYGKFYDRCLGHKIAVDTGGEIKCCLWSQEIIGNIETDDLQDLIIKGKFDFFWELTKSQIEGCKDCEMKYSCDYCSILSVKETGNYKKKPSICQYNPYKDFELK